MWVEHNEGNVQEGLKKEDKQLDYSWQLSELKSRTSPPFRLHMISIWRIWINSFVKKATPGTQT
jgi:hypothetical protein